MIKKINWMIIILAGAVILSACGNDANNNGAASSGNGGLPSKPIARMIDVELELPETAEAGEEFFAQATVTLDGEPVEDADEVVFEVWQNDNKADSTHIDGEHQGEGVYSIPLSFDEDAVYYVISHVTVEEMHNMPRKRVVVGEVSDDVLNMDEPEHDQHGDMDGHDEH